MELEDIMLEIEKIQEGLTEGTVKFTEAKGGHPADLIDEMTCDLAAKVFYDFDEEVTKSEVSEVLRELTKLNRKYKISELEKPLKELEKYAE